MPKSDRSSEGNSLLNKTLVMALSVFFSVAAASANVYQLSAPVTSMNNPLEQQKGELFELKKTEFMKNLFKRKELIGKVIYCVEGAGNQAALQSCRHMMKKL